MGTIKNNLQSREMQLFDMFGEPPQFTIHEMTLVLRSRIFLKYAAAVAILLTAFDTHGYRQAGMPLAANMLLWTVCVVAFTAVYVAVVLVWLVLAPGARRVRLLRLVPNVTAMALVSVLVLSIASGFSEIGFTRQVLLQHLPYNIFLSYIFDTLMFVFILPQVGAAQDLHLYRSKPQARASQAAPEVNRQDRAVPHSDDEVAAFNGIAVVLLGGQTFRLDQLRYVKSEEHYLRISTGDGRSVLTLRGRLADLLAQAPPEAGLQPHRSWWVARDAVAGLKRDGQSDLLLLADGSEVPVARGRRNQVRQTVQAWQAEEG